VIVGTTNLRKMGKESFGVGGNEWKEKGYSLPFKLKKGRERGFRTNGWRSNFSPITTILLYLKKWKKTGEPEGVKNMSRTETISPIGIEEGQRGGVARRRF